MDFNGLTQEARTARPGRLPFQPRTCLFTTMLTYRIRTWYVAKPRLSSLHLTHVRYAASVGTCRHHACRREDASIFPHDILQNRYNRECGLSLTFADTVCNRLHLWSMTSTCDVVSGDSTLVQRARRRWATVSHANAIDVHSIEANYPGGSLSTRAWGVDGLFGVPVTMNTLRCITDCPGISAPTFPIGRL